MSDPKKEPTDVDLDDFLDLDFGNKSNTQAQADDGLGKLASSAEPKPNPVKNLDKKDVLTPMDKPLSSKEELELEFANSKAKASTTLDFETTNDDSEPVVTPKSKGGLFGKKDKTPSNKADKKASKPKGGLFGKKTTDTNTALENSSTSTKKTKKVNPVIIGGGVVALILVVGLLFVLLSGNDAPAEPVAPPVASAPPAPPSPPPAETPPAPEAPSAPTDTPNATATTGASMIPTTTPNINPDEILKAEIPEDPALLKEEIDRLADTEKQLDEQSKMIKEQLDLMNDLTKAKDEEIALLEAQIAELEKQRAGK